MIYLVVPIMTMQLLLLSSYFRVTTEFGYDAALPAPTGAGENWGPAPGADGFGAAAGFEAATGAANVRGGGGAEGISRRTYAIGSVCLRQAQHRHF